MGKETFIMYTRYLSYAEDLSDEEFGVLMRAVFKFKKDGEEPEEGSLSPEAKMIYKLIKYDIGVNEKKYESICHARSEAGKKGAEAKRAKAAIEAKRAKKANQADNEYEDEHDNSCDDEADDEMNQEAVLNCYGSLIGRVTPRVSMILGKYDLPQELIIKAIEEAHDNNAKSLKYIEAVLKRLVEEKVTDAENFERRREGKGKKSDRVCNYNFEEIEKLEVEKRMGTAVRGEGTK